MAPQDAHATTSKGEIDFYAVMFEEGELEGGGWLENCSPFCCYGDDGGEKLEKRLRPKNARTPIFLMEPRRRQKSCAHLFRWLRRMILLTGWKKLEDEPPDRARAKTYSAGALPKQAHGCPQINLLMESYMDVSGRSVPWWPQNQQEMSEVHSPLDCISADKS